MRAREGRVDPLVLLGLARGGGGRSRTIARRITTPRRTTITTISTASSSRSRPSPIPPRWSRRLARVARAHDVLRIKGFVEIAGKPMRLLVQGVGARFQHHFDRAWKPGETRASRLVVIGEKGLDRDAVTAMLAQP